MEYYSPVEKNSAIKPQKDTQILNVTLLSEKTLVWKGYTLHESKWHSEKGKIIDSKNFCGCQGLARQSNE